MKENILNIFNESKRMLSLLEGAVLHLKRQNYDLGLRQSVDALIDFSTYIQMISEEADSLNATGEIWIDINSINDLLTEIVNVQEEMDYILLCDIYELKVIPFIQAVQNAVFAIQGEEIVFDETKYIEACERIKEYDEKLYDLLIEEPLDAIEKEQYEIEFATTGDYTLLKRQNDRAVYLHSNHDPVSSSYILADAWYKDESSMYAILGLGFGYHANELGKIDETLEIKVFESDIHVIQLSLMFGVLEEFLKNPRHKVCFDPSYTKVIRHICSDKEKINFVVHYPSLQLFQDGSMKEKLENYFIQYSSIENQKRLLHGNFRENVKKVKAPVSELKEKFQGKTAYIIAAGPSLDYNMEHLREISENAIIIAVGTVFRKLIKEKIRVDYVVISEANKRTLGQIYGLEEQNIPLLLLSTAFYGFADMYKGPKYLICQEEFEPAEKLAKEQKNFLCKTGGSVSTVALDLCMKMGCKKIVAVGLDLAYTNNYVHATDTSKRNISEVKYLRIIHDIYGKEVYTTRSLDMFRQWIEHHIKDVNDIEFLNATEGGANIVGMKNVRLADVID